MKNLVCFVCYKKSHIIDNDLKLRELGFGLSRLNVVDRPCVVLILVELMCVIHPKLNTREFGFNWQLNGTVFLLTRNY